MGSRTDSRVDVDQPPAGFDEIVEIFRWNSFLEPARERNRILEFCGIWWDDTKNF